MENRKTIAVQVIQQCLSLIVLAVILAFSVNALRADKLPIIGDWSEEARFSDAKGESLVVSVDEAGQVFESGEALFVDARSNEDYKAGHIRGAVNLPWQDVSQSFTKTARFLEGRAMIITYCDGESCDLSHELALFLKDMGFNNVRVLVNGWTVWREKGLPWDEGE